MNIARTRHHVSRGLRYLALATPVDKPRMEGALSPPMGMGVAILVFLAVFTFALGVVAGLRSLTAPAVVAWAAHLHWLNIEGSSVAFIGSTAAVAILTLLAVAELVADKLPSTPSRTKLLGLSARIVTGALSGAAVLVPGGGTAFILGGFFGAAGGIAGAFAGYQVRTRLVRALKVPDFVIAVLEDAVAIGGGLWIASRF